jgi:hypothetical protein
VFDEAHIYIFRCLVNDLGADVNLPMARIDGATAVYAAAQLNFLAVMRCLVKELGTDAHEARHNGAKPCTLQLSKDTWLWPNASSENLAETPT